MSQRVFVRNLGGTPIVSSIMETGDSPSFGTLTLTGGQIAFPATENPSSDPNTLDDYEEGSWTPAGTFATPGDLSIAYLQQFGQYTKVGRLVTAWYDLRTSTFTHTTASGAFSITGLPFTVKSGSLNYRGGTCAWSGITKANYTDMTAAAVQNTTTIQFSISGSGQAAGNLSATDMPTGGSVLLLGCTIYEV